MFQKNIGKCVQESNLERMYCLKITKKFLKIIRNEVFKISFE